MTEKDMKELEQYRALGTVSEVQQAVEKQKQKKPIYVGNLKYCCPNCNRVPESHKNSRIDYENDISYCEFCGQCINWIGF